MPPGAEQQSADYNYPNFAHTNYQEFYEPEGIAISTRLSAAQTSLENTLSHLKDLKVVRGYSYIVALDKDNPGLFDQRNRTCFEANHRVSQILNHLGQRTYLAGYTPRYPVLGLVKESLEFIFPSEIYNAALEQPATVESEEVAEQVAESEAIAEQVKAEPVVSFLLSLLWFLRSWLPYLQDPPWCIFRKPLLE